MPQDLCSAGGGGHRPGTDGRLASAPFVQPPWPTLPPVTHARLDPTPTLDHGTAPLAPPPPQRLPASPTATTPLSESASPATVTRELGSASACTTPVSTTPASTPCAVGGGVGGRADAGPPAVAAATPARGAPGSHCAEAAATRFRRRSTGQLRLPELDPGAAGAAARAAAGLHASVDDSRVLLLQLRGEPAECSVCEAQPGDVQGQGAGASQALLVRRAWGDAAPATDQQPDGAQLLQQRRQASSAAAPHADTGTARTRRSGRDIRAAFDKLQGRIQGLEASNAELQERLIQVQTALAQSQAEVAAAADARARAEAALQLGRRQAHGSEHKLEAVSQQLEARVQELRHTQDTLTSRDRALQAAEAQLVDLREDVALAKKQLEAGTRKLVAEAEDGRRWAGEALAQKREAAAVREALAKAHIEASDLRERMRRAQVESADRARQAHADAAAAQQAVMDARAQLCCLEERNAQMQQQLAASCRRAEGLEQQLAASQRRMEALQQQAEAAAAAAAAAAAPPVAQAALPGAAAGCDWGPHSLGARGAGGTPWLAEGDHHAHPRPQWAHPWHVTLDSGFGATTAYAAQPSHSAPQPHPAPAAVPGSPTARPSSPATGGLTRVDGGASASPPAWPPPLRQHLNSLCDPPSPFLDSEPSSCTALPASPDPQPYRRVQLTPWAPAAPPNPSASAPLVPGGLEAAGPWPARAAPSGHLLGRADAADDGSALCVRGGTSPYGTELTLAELLERTKHVEDALLQRCAERDRLEAEYARMPLHGGRTLAERRRKGEVEARLGELGREVSTMRLQLKRLLGR